MANFWFELFLFIFIGNEGDTAIEFQELELELKLEQKIAQIAGVPLLWNVQFMVAAYVCAVAYLHILCI